MLYKINEFFQNSWLAFLALLLALFYAIAISYNFFLSVEGKIVTIDNSEFEGIITLHMFSDYKVSSGNIVIIIPKENVKIAFLGLEDN